MNGNPLLRGKDVIPGMVPRGSLIFSFHEEWWFDILELLGSRPNVQTIRRRSTKQNCFGRPLVTVISFGFDFAFSGVPFFCPWKQASDK